MSCRAAYQQQRGGAIVVAHRGPVHRRPAPRWTERPGGDIVFRRPPREEGVRFRVEVIIDILGRRGVQRLEERKRRLGIRGELIGRWVSAKGESAGVLQVRVGRQPLAELVDRSGDGRVDAFYVRDDRERHRDAR